MFPGRVDTVADAQTVEPEQDAVRLSGRDIVEIERNDIASGYIAGTAFFGFECPGDEPADILQLVLL